MLITGTCDNFYHKGKLKLQMELFANHSVLKQEEYSGLSQWPQCNHKDSQKRETRGKNLSNGRMRRTWFIVLALKMKGPWVSESRKSLDQKRQGSSFSFKPSETHFRHQFSSVPQLCPTLLRPHVLQHIRPPCPSPTPAAAAKSLLSGVYENSCPLSRRRWKRRGERDNRE